MKPIMSILVLCLLVSSCKTEEKQTVKRDGYYISGTAPGVYNGIRAYLETTDDRGRKVAMDTAIVMNEKFVFEGKVDYPEMLYLKINSVTGSTPLIIENKEMNVVVNKDDISNSKVEGTDANTALHLYNEKTGELSAKRFEIARQSRSANPSDNRTKSKDVNPEMEEITKKMEDFPFEFVAQHNDNPFSVILLQKLAEVKDADFPRIEASLNSLSDEQKQSVTATMLKTHLNIKKAEQAAIGATQIGQVAPAFSAPTPDGKMLSLDDVKGKLTLIDFWASWCKPCRRENPNVVKVYNKYHKKGLEIISVSLDGSRSQKDPKAAWIKAIEDDKLTWSHVSNLNYFNDPVAKAYNINSIPATYLLDQDGKIVAKNLRGDALEKKVAEYLN